MELSAFASSTSLTFRHLILLVLFFFLLSVESIKKDHFVYFVSVLFFSFFSLSNTWIYFQENEMSPSPDLIPERVDEWTWFNLRWFQGSLALYQGQDTSKPPLFLAEYPKGKGTVHNLSPGPFNFYAVQTNGLFWSNEICLQGKEQFYFDFQSEIHNHSHYYHK